VTQVVTPRRAARLLGIHKETVYRWCRDAVEGKKSRLRDVRRSVTGRYLIAERDVKRLLGE